MRTLDLDSLEIFRTVVQEGGIIRAAGKLGRVQSNVTTRIKQLEQRLGRTLIAFANGCSYRKRIEEWLGGAAVMPARTLEFASYQAMIACVAAGTGFAIVPRSLLGSLRVATEVRQHELPAKVRRNSTHLVWTGAPSRALERLQALLAD
jgi:DNA-binding transcriptional LysR family regulator